MDYFKKVVQLADTYVKENDCTKLKWSWGEALMMYSLSLLDDEIGEKRYFDFYKGYADFHYKNGVVVDQSDTCAPVLVTNELYKKTGQIKYFEMTKKGIDYLKYEPRLYEDLINHNGHSRDSKDYPKSIWVDSIMMSGVFSAIAAKDFDDKELLEFSRKQPVQFAKYLQDDESKLFHHSYWKILNRPYPRNVFWGRGNGWVVTALSMFLDYVKDDDVKTILEEVSQTLLKYQRNDYYFETVINKVGETYRESSATALISAGWLNAVNKGYLNNEYLHPAIKAFESVVDNFREDGENVYMTEISMWTIPMFVMPYRLKYGPYPGYKYVKKGENINYGVASLILAGIHYNQWKKGNSNEQ